MNTKYLDKIEDLRYNPYHDAMEDIMDYIIPLMINRKFLLRLSYILKAHNLSFDSYEAIKLKEQGIRASIWALDPITRLSYHI